ncbi:hypothetical protein ACJEKH_26330, partial [Escherichia coli]
QRLEYNAIFEKLHRLVNEMDHDLSQSAVYLKEEGVKTLLLMIKRVQQQRDHLSNQNSPKYIMSFESVKETFTKLHRT